MHVAEQHSPQRAQERVRAAVLHALERAARKVDSRTKHVPCDIWDSQSSSGLGAPEFVKVYARELEFRQSP